MFQRLDSFVVCCLFLMVQSQTGKILPPQNVSLSWRSDFEPELSWEPPQHSAKNCTYKVAVKSHLYGRDVSPWTEYIVMEGGFLKLSVKTLCNGFESEEAVVNTPYPELVKNLQCYMTSSKQANCSWEPATHSDQLRFYYWLCRQGSNVCSSLHLVQECPSYRETEDMKPVCVLQADIDDIILVVFNTTLNNMPVKNTFRRLLQNDVRPPPLEWNIIKTGNKFNITWKPPDIGDLSMWEFKINYTECGEAKLVAIKNRTSMELNLVPHCPYRVTIKAVCLYRGETPWSEEKYIDADKDPNALVYPAIIIPLMFAILAALLFVCCRKNREKVFPKVPQPRDLLSDISDNNNKSTLPNLYIPAHEEENCKITLVIDPQINKPDY